MVQLGSIKVTLVRRKPSKGEVTLVIEELRHKYNLMDIEEDIRGIKADISSWRQEKRHSSGS